MVLVFEDIFSDQFKIYPQMLKIINSCNIILQKAGSLILYQVNLMIRQNLAALDWPVTFDLTLHCVHEPILLSTS